MKFIKCLTLLATMSSSFVFAQDVRIAGSLDVSVAPPIPAHIRLAASQSMKHIRFMKLQLSKKAHQSMNVRLNRTLHIDNVNEEPTRGKNVQLEMANVPVLDQGPYGTCVTFATTAAVDAALNKGDYISQLCSLQLGRYFETNAYMPSGWNGSWGSILLNQLTVHGFVNKSNEHAVGCGGVTAYPMSYSGSLPGTDMTPEAYHAMSEPMVSMSEDSESESEPAQMAVTWSSILDIYQTAIDGANMDLVLNQVKATLNQKDRLTFGVALPGVYLGVAGAVGKYHQTSDTWVLTPEIILAFETEKDLAGHEMVITGYNDDAVAVDSYGISHKGLLTLRNSWGKNIGDKGNFYMSYSYFKTLTLEVQRVRALN